MFRPIPKDVVIFSQEFISPCLSVSGGVGGGGGSMRGGGVLQMDTDKHQLKMGESVRVV